MKDKKIYYLILFLLGSSSIDVAARSSIETRLQRLERLAKQNMELSNVTLAQKIDVLDEAVLSINKRLNDQNAMLKELAAPTRESQHLIDNLATLEAPVNSNEQKLNYIYCTELAHAKKYQEAINAFEDFVWQHPNGAYAAYAHYWLGDLNLMLWSEDNENIGAKEKALEEFSLVYKRFPEDIKASDALLKLGLIKFKDNKYKEAKDIFVKLIKEYPTSSVATIARTKLRVLSKTGKA